MTNNYLTFLLDSNVCAVEITKVLEVLNFGNFTAIPCAEPYIEGLIYSREQGITVINLRKKFGLKAKPVDKKTKIVVISVVKNIEGEGEKVTLYGLVADQVLDVLQFDDEETVSNVKTSIPKENISTVLKTEDRNIIVLSFNDL